MWFVPFGMREQQGKTKCGEQLCGQKLKAAKMKRKSKDDAKW